MSIEQLARVIYREFRAKPESQRIAGEFALIELSRLLTRIKPKHVLEIGTGIGTITKLLLTHPDRPVQITATEANRVCLAELAKNLAGVPLDGLTLVKSAVELDTADHYDLVIFDGTLDKEKQYQVFRPGTWCFVEGSRRATISALKEKLASHGLSINIENKRPGGVKFKFLSARRLFGFRHPVVKMRQLKGCSFGQVEKRPAAMR